MEKVLLFQVQDQEAQAIANLLAAMKVKCERIPAQAFRRTIGELASGNRAWSQPDRRLIADEEECAKNQRTAADGAKHAGSQRITAAGEEHAGSQRITAAGEEHAGSQRTTERGAEHTESRQKNAAEYRGEVPGESLLLFCDLSEKHFNKILALLRSHAVRIDYKAVLTPTNREWNVLRLYAELAREKAEYERMRGL